MSRGGLIFPLTASIARLDMVASRAAGAYDDDFKTVKPGFTPSYAAPVMVLAQVEMGQWLSQKQLQAGNAPDSSLTLVMHYVDLEQRGLVVAGVVVFKPGDKLLGIYDKTGTLLEEYVSPATGGLFATKVEPGGTGLGGRRNLVIMGFENRTKGLSSNP